MGGRAVLSDEEDEFEEEDGGSEKRRAGMANRDEDEDEEEEEEEGQDEYEKDGFIVDDDEEEEEEEEEEPEKAESDEERHRKKRKKKRESENYLLDDDDYMLLQDNNIPGFQRPRPASKFKRLKKAGRDAEREERSGFSDEEEAERSSKGGRSAGEKLERSLFGDAGVPLEDIGEEEEQPEEEEDVDMIGEEDEMADFIVDEEDVDETGAVVRKKKLKKKTRQAPGVSSSALQEAHEIFGDVDELLMLRKQSIARSAGDPDDLGVKKLEDEFEPLILSEKYMTEDDERIRETDVPERFQLSELITGPPPTDDESIDEESAWIYDQLASGGMSPFVTQNQVNEISKEEIGNVLTMLHVQKLDIPFIVVYRKELCSSLLKDPDLEMQGGEERTPKMRWHKVLWAVYSLDRKWLLLQKRKNALQIYYGKRFEEEARRIDDETRLALNQQLFNSVMDALKDAKSEKEVDDVDLKFNLHFPPGEGEAEEGQFKRPRRKSLYSTCYKAGLWEVANKFCLNAEQLGEHLALNKYGVEEVVDGKETPEDVAANFTCAMFETPQDVLKGARHMAAVEIGYNPAVKKPVRSLFTQKAVVSTCPTPEGNLTIDIYHQLAGVKRLNNKPLSEFGGVQWFLIQKAEEEKLLQVTIKLPEDEQKGLLDEATNVSLSTYVSKNAQLWNEQRKMILHDAFSSFILPAMEKEARSLLTTRAKNWLLMEYGKQLWNKVSVAPFHRKDAEADSEDEYESRVMACCWGPGKPATNMVMLGTAGEMVDVLYAGSISVRSQAAAEQQRKKNDQQRVLKFMTDHQPHAVCVGAANLSCRLLKDDIYEVIFKIVEDHPRDVSHTFENITIVFGDESLPHLYENSRISSDQLPGQPGIVRRAVALGRYLQNPLAMVATLCGPGKEILSWKLCPLDHFLTPDEKYEVIEQVMVDATNQVGIDINLAASHEWLFAPLQFVSGLGPRKASALQKAFVRAGSIFNRKEIPIGKFIKKKVFINAVGFLRVRRSGAASSSSHLMDLLDDTRIHPESYELAKNLAKDVYAEDASRDPNDLDDDAQEMAIEHVRERPDMLNALDIDEYAKSFSDRFGTQKKDTLHDIKMELLHGFQDWRTPFREPNPEEEFSLLSGETDDTISEGRIVQVTVRYVQDNRIVCSFDSGLKGLIMSEDYPDDACDSENIQEGDVLTCRVKNINKNRFVVYLTCKKSELSRRQYPSRDRDPYYVEEDTSKQNEQEKVRKEKELAKKHFKPRMIVHPRFKNLTADEAMEYLSDKDAGESVIRPSSKGPSFLTLTLKIYDGVYAHKDIVEGGKDHKDITSMLRLGKTLTIDNETFEDLDEVMDRYVDPLVSQLKNMLGYRKFRRGNKSEVDELLRKEKTENPMRIVYCFGISHEHPGTFILSYIRSSNPHHEYIGLYPKGFRFRKRDFDDIDRLVAYFQRNIDKPPDAGPSLRTVAAMVPMKSPSPGGFSSGGSVGSDWVGSPVNNNDWRNHTSTNRERSSTPGSRTGSRFGGRDGHPSGLPRPGRGRGRGRPNESRDSNFGSGGWGGAGPKNNDGMSSFSGAKAQNSPSKEIFPGGWAGGGDNGGASGWGSSNTTPSRSHGGDRGWSSPAYRSRGDQGDRGDVSGNAAGNRNGGSGGDGWVSANAGGGGNTGGGGGGEGKGGSGGTGWGSSLNTAAAAAGGAAGWGSNPNSGGSRDSGGGWGGDLSGSRTPS